MGKGRKKVVFASDFHLGVDARLSSKERELQVVSWLMEIRDEIQELFLVGDIFDYWYEYKTSIPKGFSDFLTALKILRNDGVKIHLFTGNHDMWMFRYFTEEYGIDVYKKPEIFNIDGKNFFVGHGDGLGPGDFVYKGIKKLFSSKISQWLFSLIHPTVALGIMKKISQRDVQKYVRPDAFGEEDEWLVQFAREYQEKNNNEVDYFIFGHRHLMYDYPLLEESRILNLGDWINYNSYAVWDGNTLDLKQYDSTK